MEGQSSETGKEEDDESSSSNYKSALDEFREKWHKELKPDLKPLTKSAAQKQEELDGEKRARSLFLQGSDLERTGKVFEAMQLYRKAIQLVPDIEFKIYESNKAALKQKRFAEKEEKENLENTNQQNIVEDEENLENVDLTLRFETLLSKSKKLFESGAAADKFLIVTTAHFSDLPTEVILYILRWVVSSDLDMKSLEIFSRVCRGFYLLARDPEIWRHACLKVWGVHVGHLPAPFNDWREMYIKKSRVHFHGCYISRTSYMRYGQNSFQDQFYRPVQLVEYFRFFRFFPDGKILMHTSAEDPQNSVARLKNRNPAQLDILKGHYRILDDLVIIMVKRDRPQDPYLMRRKVSNKSEENSKQNFYLELNIVSTGKRSFSQLKWKQYSLVQVKNQQEKTTNFDLNSTKYPPFYFSRVKSYHLEADSPLK